MKVKPFVKTSKTSQYFTLDGEPYVPIGYNESITWPNLSPIFENDIEHVEGHLKFIQKNGVNTIHLMFEDFYDSKFLFETKVGEFNEPLIKIWDKIISLCEKYDIKILFAFFDTFWLYSRWEDHPYHKKNGGVSEDIKSIMVDPAFRKALKNRIEFIIKRWGSSPAIFGWDLWNEIHPVYGQYNIENFNAYIEDVGKYIRNLENKLYGDNHVQTVSIFSELLNPKISDEMMGFHGFRRDQVLEMKEVIFRNPNLDFATIHAYGQATIDFPRDTVTPAVQMGELILMSRDNILDNRPVLDTEHGPIYGFKDKKIILKRDFDTEYFKHIQWAHFASGGAGGGMRWPNRHPHNLLASMHKEQFKLGEFIKLIDINNFNPVCLNDKVTCLNLDYECFACSDQSQAVVWLVYRETFTRRGMVDFKGKSRTITVQIPRLDAGAYLVQVFDTDKAKVIDTFTAKADRGGTNFKIRKVRYDIAAVVKKINTV